MAASANANVVRAIGDHASYPVTAATKLFKGEMISVVDGYAASLTDGTKFEGHVVEQADNTSGSAGDIEVKVLHGRYMLEVTLTNVDRNMTGAVVYAVDDNTLTLAPMSTPVGRVVQYVSTNKAIVEFDTGIGRENIAGLMGIFEPFRQCINDGGAVGAGAGVAQNWVRTSVNGPENIIGLNTNASRATNVYHNGIYIMTDSAENDGESLQIMGEPFYLNSTTKPCFFGTKILMSEATQSDVLVGLCITDTALLGGMTDGINWRKVDGSTDTKCYVEKDSTETASAASEHTMTTTAVALGFIYNGTYVIPYVNGVAGTSLAITNLPDDEALTPSIEILAGSGANNYLTVYFLDAYQIV